MFLIVALAAWGCLLSGPVGFASGNVESRLHCAACGAPTDGQTPCYCDTFMPPGEKAMDTHQDPHRIDAPPVDTLGVKQEEDDLTDKGPCSFWGVPAYDGGQCVEYVKRFWKKVWGYPKPGVHYAYQQYGTADGRRLKAYPNGCRRRPRPGDILCFDRTSRYRAGHVAIVKRVNIRTGHNQWGKILVIEQNWPLGRAGQKWLRIECSHRRWHVPRRAGMRCQGWLRATTGCARRHRGRIWYVSPGDGARNLRMVRWFNKAFYRRNSLGQRHSSKLVRPTGNAWPTGNGWYQQCQKGGLSLASGGARVCAVYRGFYSKWGSLRRWRGWLGHAMSDRYRPSPDRPVRQKFRGGYILYSGGRVTAHRWKEVVPKTEDAPEVAGLVAVTSLSALKTNAGAQIAFTLSQDAKVTAEVTNIAGRPIRLLVADRELKGGPNTLLWDTRSASGLLVPNGVYFVTVQASDKSGQTAKAMTTLHLVR